MSRMKLFRRAEVWIPTWQGWIAILCVPTVGMLIILTFAHPFLSKNQPIGGEYLVVEGWMNRRQIAKTADIFRSGSYREVIVTGGAISDGTYMRLHYPDFESVAEVGASQLRLFGIAEVHSVPRPAVHKDRTYSSALGLRKWLEDAGKKHVRLDIVASGAHSRRTLLLFKIALEGVADVGVIAFKPNGYDPDTWWSTSAGVRTMIGELIAYGYAKFLFYPSPGRDSETLFWKDNR